MNDLLTILEGDWVERLRELPDNSVHCCVTSPPYWGLRDYGVAGQLGLEETPEEYLEKLMIGFREVRRVLRGDGTLWLNLGDCYANDSKWGGATGGKHVEALHGQPIGRSKRNTGLKPKDLIGIPWMVAFALRADGWYLRSDIIWHKPNPMPESVTDRPTKAHEYIFLLSKNERYFYDAEAIKEPQSAGTFERFGNGKAPRKVTAKAFASEAGEVLSNSDYKVACPDAILPNGKRNKRTVWTVPSQPYSEAHFATFPEDLIKPCILAGTSARGCCPQCGAPWERVLNFVPSMSKPCPKTTAAHLARGGTGDPIGTVGKSGSGRVNGYTETLDWQPDCKCTTQRADARGVIDLAQIGPFPPVPCTVLDPFAGSGTTGAVALELGRKAILIELNPDYIKLIKARTCITPGLQLA